MTLSSVPGDFTLQAESYARSRPGYPRELLGRLLECCCITPGDDVTEIGAGTGLFTALLSGRGFSITALEPNEAMRRQSPHFPDVQWMPGRFESTGLPSASQAWVVAAQAFHWADPARSLPEVRRILQPGRSFTILWNHHRTSESPVLTWTHDAIRRHIPGHNLDYHSRDWAPILMSTGDFTRVAYDESRHEVMMTREQYLDLWRSQNRLAAAAGPRRLAELLDDLEANLPGEAAANLTIPYLCQAWTAHSSEAIPTLP